MNDHAGEELNLLSGIRLSDDEFQAISSLVKRRFGINLTNEKRALVVSRLQKVLREHGFKSFKQYHDYVTCDKSNVALSELINKISTNHTYFYREAEHFDFFVRRFLPETVAEAERKGDRDLRVWSAGCSSGEEPYMLVMLMREHLGVNYQRWRAGVLATDISASMLGSAAEGYYSDDRVNRMPKSLLRKYFKKVDDGLWRVVESVRNEVTFRRFNLMSREFPFKKRFHCVFCRNVMIYFDQITKDALVRKFFDSTAPGGYLFIGHSESLSRQNCPYRYVMPAVYRKESAPDA